MSTSGSDRQADSDAGRDATLPKASFDDVYDAPTPRPYFASLASLDYRTPMHAQRLVRRILGALRRQRGPQRLQILDLCCGYGVNGALAKADIGFEDLVRRYAGARSTPSAEAERRELIEARSLAAPPRVVGQDVAGNALAYAEAAGFIDAAIRANLEERPLGSEEARLVAGTDLVVVTGGLSYVGTATFERLLGALRSPPWMVLFPLRGTGVREVERTLEEAGLETERWPRTFPHRRHADDRERRETLARTSGLADGLGPASATHLEAVFHLARPPAARADISLEDIVLGRADRTGADGEID